MANLPNRHVRHKDNWEVDLNFSSTLLEELADSDPQVRDEAQRSVCTRFRTACERKYGNRWMDVRVNWDDLTITLNTPTNDDPHPDVGEGGCGCECTRCDIGYHCNKRDRGCKHSAR